MSTHTTPPRNIVIAGGGLAGTTLARALDQRLPRGWQVVLVNEAAHATVRPMLAEVVGAAVSPQRVLLPIAEQLGAGRFIVGQVQQVDSSRRTLSCATASGLCTIAYEHLVLALGQPGAMDDIPGLAAHALPLRQLGDAVALRSQLLQRLACIGHSADAQERRRLGHVVVIGGGFAGVQVAGALADLMREARRCYPRIRDGETAVTLLHDGQQLLPDLPVRLGRSAARSLAGRGVALRTGVRASLVGAHFVELDFGAVLAADTVVCTVASGSHPLVEGLGLASRGGRIATGSDCAVRAHPDLWALGDCAAVPNAADGLVCPPGAGFAIAQAEQLARNLVARIQCASTRPLHHRARGATASTGHHQGVAEVCGVPLDGLPAWLLWRARWLVRMPTWRHGLRNWAGRTWNLLSPAGFTERRFNHGGNAGHAAGFGSLLPVHPPHQ